MMYSSGVPYMAGFPQNRYYNQHSTINDLLRSTRTYNPERERLIVQNIHEALSRHNMLNVDIASYNVRGQYRDLLRLYGNIRIVFREQTYNIPIQLWITEQFPHMSPMVQVVPTANMIIPPNHGNVDERGNVMHPYIRNWNANCSIVDLLDTLCRVFGEQPPVQQKRRAPDRGPLLRAVHDAAYARLESMDHLYSRYNDLLEKRAHSLSEADEINRRIDERHEHEQSLSKVIAEKRKKVLSLETWVENNQVEKNSGMLLSSLPESTAELYRCAAVDKAYRDAFKLLDSGLETHDLDNQFVLKETRRLALEQFKAVALQRKIMLELAEQERKSV